MKKTTKLIIITVSIIILAGIGFITYYSLSNFAWYGNGGHVEWIKYSEIPILFGDNVLYLSRDYFSPNGMEYDFTLDVGFSGRSKTIYNEKVSGYDPKASYYSFFFELNYAISDAVSFTEFILSYEKEGQRPEFSPPEVKYGELYYSVVNNKNNSIIYIRKGKQLLEIMFLTTAQLEKDAFETYCLENIMPYIVH